MQHKTHNEKVKILIFGASKAGEALFTSIKGEYDIVGFMDNNAQIQGEKLFSKLIYSPADIEHITFDKVVIASDYRVEIYQQLSEQLHVKKNKITFPTELNLSNEERTFIERFSCRAINFILNAPALLASIAFCLLSVFFNHKRATKLREIVWFDQLDSFKVCTFRTAEKARLASPKFIGQAQKTYLANIPEVSLFYFKCGQIMPTINAVVFGANKIAMGRVPSFPVKFSQFSSAFISEHSEKRALIKQYPMKKLARGVAITGSNDTNYYHWVIDVLCKFEFIAELPKEYDDFPILISEKAQQIPAINEYIKHFNISRKVIYLNSQRYYEVEELLYVTSPNYLVANLKEGRSHTSNSCYTRADSLNFLRSTLLSVKSANNGNTSPKRIFLARKGNLRGYNQDEVWAVLQQYGFTSIYLEDYTLLQQVALMHNAKIIIGPTGAAWTNLIFCREETLALCWMAEEIGELACFSNLAEFSNVDLEYIGYKAGSTNTRNLYNAAYTIDVDNITDWLDNKGIIKKV